jgi:heavy metal sensor kinase
MKTASIRFRLTVWFAGLLSAAFVALGALFFVHLKHYLENTLIEAQSFRAQQIAGTLLAPDEKVDVADLSRRIEALYAPEKSDRFIRITRQDGTVLYRSGVPNDQAFVPAEIPAVPLSPSRASSRKQSTPDGGALLIATVRAAVAEGPLYVEVGVPAAPVDAMFRHLLLLLGLALPVVGATAAVGGYLLVRRALQPVDRLAAKAEQITHENLSERLPVARTGDELERLSISLNRMITRLDEEFKHSKRFVADASHELRTPLTVLRGELEALAQDESFSADQREILGSLLEEIERLSKIVDRMFTLSRLDAGEAQAEWVEFDLAALAAGTADEMALLAADKRIVITCEPGHTVPVLGDRARVKQVIVNLLDNAIKYTGAGGAIGLQAARVDGRGVLKVVDTGIGIAPDALPHVFERFFRVDPSRSPDTGGAGLGLAIVQSICSAHGAELEVESAVGRGTCFRVKFPLAGTAGA